MDVGFANQTGDEEFLSTFIQVVEMAVNLHRPDLILYDAGVDIHNDDELGYLSISQPLSRNEIVLCWVWQSSRAFQSLVS